MVEYLTRAIMAWIVVPSGAALLLAACFLNGTAHAQMLSDPTRPPASVLSGEARADGVNPAAYSGPVLQSILISSVRKEAIISGQTVRVGDRVGEAQVSQITENEVELRSGKNTQTLKLFPNVEKRANTARKGTSAGSRPQ